MRDSEVLQMLASSGSAARAAVRSSWPASLRACSQGGGSAEARGLLRRHWDAAASRRPEKKTMRVVRKGLDLVCGAKQELGAVSRWRQGGARAVEDRHVEQRAVRKGRGKKIASRGGSAAGAMENLLAAACVWLQDPGVFYRCTRLRAISACPSHESRRRP